MHYVNIIEEFETNYDAYFLLKEKTYPEFSLVSDKDKEKKIIKCVPLFEDSISRTFRRKGPLVYIFQDNFDVPGIIDYPLTENAHYGESGYVLGELINPLPHVGPIFVVTIKLSL